MYLRSKCTLPETNMSPLKLGHPRRKGSYSNHPFSRALAVSFRESILLPNFPHSLGCAPPLVDTLEDMFGSSLKASMRAAVVMTGGL